MHTTETRRTITLKPTEARHGQTLCGILGGLLLAALMLFVPGCQTTPPVTPTDTVPYSTAVLREGDSIKIAFPGAPNQDSVQQVRRDGKITLSLGGEMIAAGKTPAEIEKEVLKVYGDQLAVKQVVVTVTSSAYPIFVSGAVLRPGKISADRPMTALEAIMEAGGFDHAKADLKKVTVLREFEGQTVSYIIDMRKVLQGEPGTKPFYLKPADKIHVPQKFNWF